MTTVAIRGEGRASITIELYKYEFSDATNDDDLSWIVSSVAVTNHPFSGSVAGSLRTDDLDHLRDLLETLSTPGPEVSFATLEESLTIRGRMNQTGKVSLQVELRAAGVSTLTTSIFTDRTLIARAIEELDQALRAFPLRRARA